MIKYIFFKLIDFIHAFSKTDFHVLDRYEFTDGNVYIEYIHNNKRYVYTGDGDKFPPHIRLGFNPCITEAITQDGKCITEHIKRCAGPKHDFYGDPNPSLMLGKFIMRLKCAFEYGKISLKLVPMLKPADPTKKIITMNVFNQIQVLEKK